MAMQGRIVDVSQIEFDARIQELSQDPISMIQKEVKALSILQSYNLTSRIDGEEIDREVEIISNYMKKTKSFYKSRKRNFKI
jgi:ribosomal protein S13